MQSRLSIESEIKQPDLSEATPPPPLHNSAGHATNRGHAASGTLAWWTLWKPFRDVAEAVLMRIWQGHAAILSRVQGMMCGVWGVGCEVWGFGCAVWGGGFRAWGVGCGVQAMGCGVWSTVHGVWSVGRCVWSVCCWVRTVGFGVQWKGCSEWGARHGVSGVGGWSVWCSDRARSSRLEAKSVTGSL